MALTGQFQLVMNLLANVSLDLGVREFRLRTYWGPTITDGNAADQGQVLYADTITLADGGNTTLDFYDGTLLDVNGVALTMTELKGLVIRNNSADATLLIGGAAGTQLALFNDAASDKLKLPPGSTTNPSIFAICVPSATGIVCSTNSDLKLEHDGTGSSTMNVDIVAWGSD
jgi:hypothetical protein